jgi:hypothetical protein
MSMPLKTKAESMLMISMGTLRAKANAAAVLPEAVGPRMKRALGLDMVLGCDAGEVRIISGFPKVNLVLKGFTFGCLLACKPRHKYKKSQGHDPGFYFTFGCLVSIRGLYTALTI